jgi:hypothetical protein
MSFQNGSDKARPSYMPLICFRCDAPMKIKTITPTMISPSLDEVVYRCLACNDERTQTVLRND